MPERVAYQIQIVGDADPRLADWFDGIVVQHGPSGDDFVLTRPIDQAGLRGVLSALFDLNITVRSVQPVPADDDVTPGEGPSPD